MFLQLGATRNPSDSFPLGFSWRLPKDGQKEETQHWEATAGDNLGALLVPRGHIQLVALCQEAPSAGLRHRLVVLCWCCPASPCPQRSQRNARGHLKAVGRAEGHRMWLCRLTFGRQGCWEEPQGNGGADRAGG